MTNTGALERQIATTLVTGATGFVGCALVQRLATHSDWQHVVVALRHSDNSWPAGVQPIAVGAITPTTDWHAALQGVTHVVHLAARVHVMHDSSADPLAEFRRVNLEGTANLARQAVAAGVKRFVYLSSAKVNGESTLPQRPFTAADTPVPEDAYAISKLEAEQALWRIAAHTGMEVVVIRPPLVYGPGVKANFAAMLRWLARGLPLPLAGVTHNRRSLVGLDNLVDFIVTCLQHPGAANQTFLVSDGADLSTADLLRRAGTALGQPARLFYVHPYLLQWGAKLLRKGPVYQRLCGSLQLDIQKNQQLLGWTPPLSVEEGLRRTIEGVAS